MRALLTSAGGSRHGIVRRPQLSPRSPDMPTGLFNVAVPADNVEGWTSASGGIARTEAEATMAAVGEALERYAAYACPLMERAAVDVTERSLLPLTAFSLFSADQQSRAEFPHTLAAHESPVTDVYSLEDNARRWAPASLVGLRPGGLASSSGLAAERSAVRALLRAAQELVERDALSITWLHGVPGRQVELPARLCDEVAALGGSVTCVDATPAYSPHPVAIVCGSLPREGRPRISLGSACRETWDAAAEKAYLEWAQGVAFAGIYTEWHPELRLDDPGEIGSFDEHAVYYTLHPELWPRVALLHGAPAVPPQARSTGDAGEELLLLTRELARHGIDLFYRDLTTMDVRQVGVRVVRVLSPQLLPLSCSHAWPHLGGTASDVELRYPWVDRSRLCFPNPAPHPLG